MACLLLSGRRGVLWLALTVMLAWCMTHCGSFAAPPTISRLPKFHGTPKYNLELHQSLPGNELIPKKPPHIKATNYRLQDKTPVEVTPPAPNKAYDERRND
ncbi:hypothetical protein CAUPRSCDRAFT_11294 [Caulochytrium protostelioides]|uniref:Uncharacterized protein n=1 Tax=Caulochytrium protostelioides TaxID=1555241 RepID=A0A4P9WUQ8_9FUNG|nr:hypothetical protein CAUPRSCDRAFT_11294 [Caulochytrium protostelioides]